MTPERRQELLSKEYLRLREVAELVQMSKRKVAEDARRGYLRVIRVRCGTRWMAHVEQDEAQRYKAELRA